MSGATSFPLMSGFDHVRAVGNLDPVAAVQDAELGVRMREYSRLLPAGAPDFGHAVQRGSRWRIGSLGGSHPSGSRMGVAIDLRQRVADEDPEPELAAAMTAAANRLDPEEGAPSVTNEWEIGDHRYRTIRVEKFTLYRTGEMEPPRPSDPEPAVDPDGMLIDPSAPTGHWEAQLRLNLVDFLGPTIDSVPKDIVAEAELAARTLVGVVLLPPTYTVFEMTETERRPAGGGDSPEKARDSLARYLSEVQPMLRKFQGNPATPAEKAEWTAAADQINATKGHAFNVLGRKYRTVRISRMLRLGPDGPETIRPSDEQHYNLS